MVTLLRRIGSRVLFRLEGLGRATIMWGLAMATLPRKGDMTLLFRQIYSIGVLSIAIIVLSAFAIGAVISLQFYTQLSRFGAEDAVGAGLALVLLRELGPVVTGLLFAGRAGSAITAEIGLMKTTEQLSIMEMMGVDPLRRIVAPRLWGGIISMPLLTAIFNVVGIYGGMQDAVDIREDIVNGMLKAAIFAVVVTWIAVFQGYDCEPTAEGMGRATTRTVVTSSVLILALDFFLTLSMYGDF
jgi:phospholipid/cholesterol/gamma-HCH transport system permease protein